MSTPEPNPLAAVSSPDHNRERLDALKKRFPDLFTNEGRLNVDELKKVVDPALVSETERYDFRWYGKTRSKRQAFTPSSGALAYDAKRSQHPDKANGNLIIEGENLEVLKLLTRPTTPATTSSIPTTTPKAASPTGSKPALPKPASRWTPTPKATAVSTPTGSR